MKLRTALIGGILISATVALGAGFIALVTSRTAEQALANQTAAHSILRAFHQQSILTTDYLQYGNKRSEQQWLERHASLSELLDSATGIVGADLPRLQVIAQMHKDMGQIFEGLRAVENERPESAAARERQSRQIDRLTGQLAVVSQRVADETSAVADDAKARIRSALDEFNLVLVLMASVLVVGPAVTWVFVAWRVVGPVRRVREGILAMGQGDLDHRISGTGRDEIGDIAVLLNTMAARLKEITASRDELDREVAERKAAEEALRLANTELAATNHELEAFCYSVSHDLRAPLRAIHGFSTALKEDYADKLDDDGKNWLTRICNGAGRLSHLIDDLLDLSRITRAAMEREEVNLSVIAEAVVDELRDGQPDHEVAVTIEPQCRAEGDPTLLLAVLQNLLGNAWKFTAQNPSAAIAFGRNTGTSGTETFYVRDNGVGFDMAHASKLFAPFQRLHHRDEFDGTGVGLATVHRVIKRHGGDVWVEARKGAGATFYFTLGNDLEEKHGQGESHSVG